MLLPYYIASMNIEHEYMEQTGQYRSFEGTCLVDTFDMRAQATMFAEKNLERIERQRSAPIFVVIGNPPYNAGQESENDNNKNRRYVKDGGVDLRISETYSKASKATNKNALSDPYVKAIRWASDRVGSEGVVAFVTNSGFIDGISTDGMRKQLAADFDEIYILDLGGNVRKNPKLSGSTHNVFEIQVGVSINIFVRRDVLAEKRKCTISYAHTDEYWTRGRKEEFLAEASDRNGIRFQASKDGLDLGQLYVSSHSRDGFSATMLERNR
jgi:predicted helicase